MKLLDKKAGLGLLKHHTESSTHRQNQKIDITLDQKAEMVVLRNEGKSYFDISVELGVPENRIVEYLKDHSGVTFKQVRSEPVSDEVIARMVVLRNEGKTYPEIGAELDLSRYSVSRHLKKHPDVTFKSPFS